MFNPSLKIRRLLASFAAVTCLSALGLSAHALETVDKGAFTIAFSGDMPGTGYQDGKMVGYDGEILQRIARAEGAAQHAGQPGAPAHVGTHGGPGRRFAVLYR